MQYTDGIQTIPSLTLPMSKFQVMIGASQLYGCADKTASFRENVPGYQWLCVALYSPHGVIYMGEYTTLRVTPFPVAFLAYDNVF